ncbi:MAG: FG-GAP repeat protein, partial [Dehalococcoidia bacterium]
MRVKYGEAWQGGQRALLGAGAVALAVIVACSGGGSGSERTDDVGAAPESAAVTEVDGKSTESDPASLRGYSAGSVADAERDGASGDARPAADVSRTPRATVAGFSEIDAREFRLDPNDAAAFDEAGWSVAIDGDTIVVGAPLHDDLGTDSGVAYVFERAGERWLETAKLLPDEGEAGAWFGRWVAVDGDTIVLGAPLADVVGEDDDAG